MAQTIRPPRKPRTRASLPEQAISREVLLEKYAKDGETTAAQVRARVARALAAAEPEGKRARAEAQFAEAMERGGAARLVRDAEMNGERLFALAGELAAQLETMGEAARKFARPGAAGRAADILEEIGRDFN